MIHLWKRRFLPFVYIVTFSIYLSIFASLLQMQWYKSTKEQLYSLILLAALKSRCACLVKRFFSLNWIIQIIIYFYCFVSFSQISAALVGCCVSSRGQHWSSVWPKNHIFYALSFQHRVLFKLIWTDIILNIYFQGWYVTEYI